MACHLPFTAIAKLLNLLQLVCPVTHMGLVTLGLFSHTSQGLVAAIFLMLAHGLVSSALFMGVTFLYERHFTRLIKYYWGVVTTMPLFGVLLFVLVLANASIPLSCGFIGEFYSLWAAFEYSLIAGALASTGIVISAGYSIYMYNRMCFGWFSRYVLFSRDLNRREYFSLLPLVFLIVILGVFPFLVIDVVKGALVHLNLLVLVVDGLNGFDNDNEVCLYTINHLPKSVHKFKNFCHYSSPYSTQFYVMHSTPNIYLARRNAVNAMFLNQTFT